MKNIKDKLNESLINEANDKLLSKDEIENILNAIDCVVCEYDGNWSFEGNYNKLVNFIRKEKAKNIEDVFWLYDQFNGQVGVIWDGDYFPVYDELFKQIEENM